MKRFREIGYFATAIGAMLFVTGCSSSYYMVKDPHSGQVYYTEQVENLKDGAVKLKDGRDGSTVTIQNSEVKEISSKDYQAGLKAPAETPAPAAAVPSAAPAAAPAAVPVAPAAAPTAAPTPSPTEAK